MTTYDAVMIGIIVLGMIWGVLRGFTWQVASLGSLGVGFVSSHQLSARIAPHLPGEPIVARSLSMLVAYILISGLIFFGSWLLRATIRRMRLEAYDRHLGMILGGLEGAFLGVVGTFFVVSLAPATREPIFESRSGQVVGQIMTKVGPALPDEARAVIEPILAGKPIATDGKLVDSWIDEATKSVASRATQAKSKAETGGQDWWDSVSDRLKGQPAADRTTAATSAAQDTRTANQAKNRSSRDQIGRRGNAADNAADSRRR